MAPQTQDIRKKNRKIALSRLATTAANIALCLLCVFLAKRAGSDFWRFYPAFSRTVTGFLGRVFSFTDFTLWERLLAAIVALALAILIAGLFNKSFWKRLCGALMIVSAGAFLYLTIWGLNYFAPSAASRVGLEDKLYTPQELAEATAYFAEEAEVWADRFPRDEQGLMITDVGDFSYEVNRSCDALAASYPDFSAPRVSAKTLACSPLMAKVGTVGMFVALTGESGVSSKVFSAAMPFTIAHEIGHRLSFARENEANFVAYMICENSDDPRLKYSACYMAYTYCGNALYKVDPELYGEVAARLGPLLRAELSATNRHYDSLTDRKAEAAYDKVYDAYLKTMDVDSGMQSYGEVVDLLVMWYYQKIK